MLSDAEIDALARHLAEIRRRREHVRFPPGIAAVSHGDAYRIQHRLRALLDGDAVSSAIKVSGLKKQGGSGALGVPGPFFAWLPASALQTNGATIVPTYPVFGVECELAVRIGLAPDGTPEVRAVMAAFELIEMRCASLADTPLELLLTDGLNTCGGVLGPPRPDWPEELEKRSIRIWINELLVHEGLAGNRIAHPRSAIAAFLAQGPQHGFVPREGMILYTGNLSREFWVAHGDRVRAEIDGFAAVETRFA